MSDLENIPKPLTDPSLINKYAIIYQYEYSIKIGIVWERSIEMAKFKLWLLLQEYKPHLRYGSAVIWGEFHMN